MKKNILYLFVIMLLISACDIKEDYEQINSNVVEAAGEWWVEYSDDAGYNSGFYKLLTYNTADDNGEEFWITDENQKWWDYKIKCPVAIESLTFSGSDLANIAYDVSINVSNGKIIEKVSLQPSGVLSDSIYFDIEFGDEPGTIYHVSGFRKTGFLEDEH